MNRLSCAPQLTIPNVLPSLLSSLGMVVVQVSPDLRLYEVQPPCSWSMRIGEPLDVYLDICDPHQFEVTLAWCRRHPGSPREFAARIRGVHRERIRQGWVSAMVSSGDHIGYALTLLSPDAVAQKRRASAAQLRRIDALANTGMLAATTAHEVATPLTEARLTLTLAQRRLAEHSLDAETTDMLNAVSANIDDVCQLTRNLIRVAAGPELRQPVACDLHIALDGVIALVAGSLKSRALLVRNYDNVPRVMAEPSELTHLLTNLIVNAIQAMPVGDAMANMLSIDLKQNGSTVRIAVRDTGSGIADEDLDRVFEPFFTTKANGSGTGLGLSVCRRIVSELGGAIGVSSELGKGTTFLVTLPMAVTCPSIH